MIRRGDWGFWFTVACVVMGTQLAFGQGSVNPPKQSVDPPQRTSSPGTPVDGAPGSVGAPNVGAPAEFDVVSIKPVQPGGVARESLQYTRDGIRLQVPLSTLVQQAYGGSMNFPTDDSISGLPDWGKTEYFTVEAKMNGDEAAEFKQLSKDGQQQRRGTMLQALLADRFKLKVHRETKQVPDYELVIAKGGPKLQEGDINPNGPKDMNGKPIAGSSMGMHGIGNVQAQATSMEQLANFLALPLVGAGRVVKDKTGLTGKYNFALNFAPVLGSARGPATETAPLDDSAPSIFIALPEQLGLKLQPGTGTIDVLVIDHVERPTAD